MLRPTEKLTKCAIVKYAVSQITVVPADNLRCSCTEASAKTPLSCFIMCTDKARNSVYMYVRYT